MKISTLLPIVLILLSACKGKHDKNTKIDQPTKTSSHEPGNNFVPNKPYPFEKGEIHYKYAGSYVGTQTIYFKDFGRTFTVEDNYINQSSPLHEKVRQLFINAGTNFYYIDQVTGKGFVLNRDSSSTKLEGNMLYDFGQYGIDSTMKMHKFKKGGLQEILGKECQTYHSDDGKFEFWFWQGINMKSRVQLGQKIQYNLEATDIDKNGRPDDSKFSPPSGVKVMKYDNYIKSETTDQL